MPSWVGMTWKEANLLLPEAVDTEQKKQRFRSKLAALAAVIEQQQPVVRAVQEIDTGGTLHPGMLKGDRHSTDACG